MPLHIDYRPTSLEEVIGNDGIKESIKSVFTRDDKPHCVLMMGPKGSGKTTIARIIATMVGCHADDIQEYNCATNNGIDTVRAISENAQYSPMSGSVKVYILDECHCLTKGKQGAQNSLLKITEDTPKHVFFILCTTEPEELLPALASRCMKFEVKSLNPIQQTKLLKETIVSEGINLADFSEQVIKDIVKAADGCPRQALILLDSVIDIEDEQAALLAIAEAVATETATIEVSRLLLSDRKNRWPDMKFLLVSLGDDAEKVRYSILGYMATILLSDRTDAKTSERASQIIDQFTESFMYSKKAGLYNACYNACKM